MLFIQAMSRLFKLMSMRTMSPFTFGRILSYERVQNTRGLKPSLHAGAGLLIQRQVRVCHTDLLHPSFNFRDGSCGFIVQYGTCWACL